MASNSNGNSSSVASQASIAKAKARLERLLDTSYAKIEELRQLLNKESNLRWKDCTKEIDPVIIRQRSLHETAMRRLNQVLGTDDTSNKHAVKYTGRNSQVHGQPKNVRFLQSLPLAPKTSLPHSYSLPSMGYPTLPTKEIPFEPISESRRDEPVQIIKYNNKDDKLLLPLQTKDDKQWYGSLDRNMVKKKKRGPVDKARRHTKIVGSMAALERTDELQPDEQYKIGLPTLARLDSLSLAGHTLTKPRSSPPPLVSRIKASPSPPPPPPPPKTNNLFSRGAPTGKLPMVPDFEGNHSVPRYQGMPNLLTVVSLNPIGTILERPENKEMFSTIPGWLETDLDGPAFKPLNYPSESLQVATSGFNTGYLDTTDSLTRPAMTSPATDISEKSSKSSESEMRIFLNETIKPFEMADYYKYSTKYRQSQNTSQMGELGQLDLANGNPTVGSLNVDEFNGNTNPNAVPKLPPRDLPTNARSTSKAGKSHSEKTQMVPVGSIDDSDLGWVMDTPTIV